MRFPPPRPGQPLSIGHGKQVESTDFKAPNLKNRNSHFTEIKGSGCHCNSIYYIHLYKIGINMYCQSSTIFGDKYDMSNIPYGFSYVAHIDKYLSIILDILLLSIKIILKITLNLTI